MLNRSGLYVNHMQYLDNLEGRRSDRENMLKAFEQQRLISVDEQRQMQQSAVSGVPAPEHIQLRINEYYASTKQIKQSKEFADMMRLIKTNRPHKGE